MKSYCYNSGENFYKALRPDRKVNPEKIWTIYRRVPGTKRKYEELCTAVDKQEVIAKIHKYVETEQG